MWILAVGIVAVDDALPDVSQRSEQTALDGLLAITEAQARFAVRSGRYATSIAELGLQTSVMSAGQLTMKAAYEADYDNPQRVAADGYFFRVLPVREQALGNASNSFWAVAIPESSRSDLPVYVTAAHRIRSINFPLVNWWALRLHDTNRLVIATLLAKQPAVAFQDIGLDYDKPESFPNALVVRRFMLDPNVKYPPTEAPELATTDYPMILIIGGGVLVVLILLFKRRPKRR